MPSTRDPNEVVNPGPGKLPAGTVPSSAFISIGGGGSGVALIQAHMADPVDAHMASAIGIEPVYALTGEALLTSAGGLIPGESVLDFIATMKDLLPLRPNYLGYSDANLPLDGVPVWSTLSTPGGYTAGGSFVATHHIWSAGVTSIQAAGSLFPADRGMLAIYLSTDGNYLNAGSTTLIGALWLGGDPPPAGVPGSNFLEASRLTAQVDYTASGTGLDQISLAWRLPYLKDYTAYPGAPYPAFDANFYRYQMAQFLTAPVAVAAGTPRSLLVVHWREAYATTLAKIQPSQLAAYLIQANCYTPAPVAGVFDGGNIETVNRHNFIVDTGGTPVISSYSYTVASGTTEYLSGVQSYNTLTINGSFQISNLFDTGYYTGAESPPNVPVGFASPAIVKLAFGDLGGADVEYGYYDLADGGATPFSTTNPPLSGDTANGTLTGVAIPTPTAYTPDGGVGAITLGAYCPWAAPVTSTGGNLVLFNSHPKTGGGTLSTETFEPFVDEKYRYVSAYAGSAPSPPLVPSGGDVFDPTGVLVGSDGKLQVVGHRLAYPTIDYTTHLPPGADYAAVLSSDGASHIRRYVRLFNTGIARNIGKLRIRGLSAAAFAASTPFSGNEATDHPGGAVVQLRIPGITGWLDLGRVKGDPDLTTTDGRGCRTSLTVVGSDLIVGYDTTEYSVNNGSGDFPIILRIGLIKNGTGQNLTVTEVEWQAP